MYGGRLGLLSFTVQENLGGAACKVSTWVSDKSVVCGIGRGVGASMLTALTVGRSVWSMTEAVSMDCALVSAITRANTAVSESASITIYRGMLGAAVYSLSGREGAMVCKSTDWVSDTAVQIRGGQGGMGSVCI